eukprot:UN22645
MKLKHSLIFIALLSTTTVAATPPVGAKLAGAKETQQDNACKFNIKFSSDPKQKQQLLNVAPNVDLKLKQFIAMQSVKGAKIATNVMCQQLIGQQYTGSQQEWQGFINNALNGLKNAGFENLSLTRVGSNDAIYKGELDNYEYIFAGDIGGNKQVIHNLAVLDKAN